jgi:hypothetical protein
MYGRFAVSVIAIAAWIALPVFSDLISATGKTNDRGPECPSGKFSADLTGWALDGKYPSGSATYDGGTNQLEVSVESVNMPDGKMLTLRIGEDRIGEIGPLSAGSARGIITRTLAEGDRVRVFDADRPIVSGNLTCVAAPVMTPTQSPSPMPDPSPPESPSPTSTPTPTPSPDMSPEPTATPAPDPVELPVTPMPTPSAARKI